MSLAHFVALQRAFGGNEKKSTYEDDNDPILDALLPYLSPYYNYSLYGTPVKGGTNAEDESPGLDFL